MEDTSIDDMNNMIQPQRTGESVYYNLAFVMKKKKRLIVAYYIKEKDYAH
jgi:hypothetical protein